MLPAKPGMSRHKGKVEAGVKYAHSNGLARRQFSSLTDQNQFLSSWEKNVADTRIHGTTREQVRHRFETLEKPALQPLPLSLFPVFSAAPRQVHRDGYVEVAKAYYSVPPEYVGRSVWARWDTGLGRIYNVDMKLLTLHPRRQSGASDTLDEHIHSHKRCIIERALITCCTVVGFWARTLRVGPRPCNRTVASKGCGCSKACCI